MSTLLTYYCGRKLAEGMTRQELAVELAKPENLGDHPTRIKDILDAAEALEKEKQCQ